MTDITPARSWAWKPKLRWFAAEFLVVVTGILVAIALNAWYQQRQDAANEATYLSLLSRDVERIINRLAEEGDFENLQLRDGLVAYRALSSPAHAHNLKAASAALGALTTRRTLILPDATYRDLISTGNLRLIRNRALRDRIVDYFEGMQTLFEIMNKNNAVFVDDVYNRTIVGFVLPKATLQNVKSLAQLDTTLATMLQGGFVEQPDPLWSLPADSPELLRIKSALLMRIRVAALARQFVENQLNGSRELKRLLDTERAKL